MKDLARLFQCPSETIRKILRYDTYVDVMPRAMPLPEVNGAAEPDEVAASLARLGGMLKQEGVDALGEMVEAIAAQKAKAPDALIEELRGEKREPE